MPPRRDFRAKKKVTVSIVKEVKQEKGQCLDDVASIADENFVDDETWSDLQEDSTKKKRKFRRVRLRSIKAQGLPRQKGKTCCFLALCQARTCFSPFGKDASVALGSLCEEHRNCSCWRIPTPSSNLEGWQIPSLHI
ncbi:uncharacterized protein LOC144631448 [Oculina patagonica]